jgi:tetratricopeptide (TPR) repeat protein
MALGEVGDRRNRCPGIRRTAQDRWFTRWSSLARRADLASLPARVQGSWSQRSRAAVIVVNDRCGRVRLRAYDASPRIAPSFRDAAGFRTPEDECRFDREHLRAEEANDLAAALARVDQSLQQCPDDVPTRTQFRFNTLIGLGRFDEARPLAEALLERPPSDPRGHASLTYAAGLAFLETGSPELAERWLLASRQLGNRSCAIERQLARAAIASLQPDLASQRFEAAYLCDGSRNPGLLIDAATWSVTAGQPERTRKLLARVRGEQPIGSPLERRVAQVEAQLERMGRPR